MKYVKNTTESSKIYVGVNLDSLEVRLIEKLDENIWASDSNVLDAITSGELAVSTDGINFLNPSVGLITITSEQSLITLYASATNLVSTSSSSFSVVGSMTVTPPAGDYLIFFGTKANTSGVNAQSEYGIYIGGILVPETKRELSCSLSLLGIITVSVNTIGVEARTSSKVSVNGTQSIDVRFRSINGVSIAFGERSLTLVKVS